MIGREKGSKEQTEHNVQSKHLVKKQKPRILREEVVAGSNKNDVLSRDYQVSWELQSC